MFEFAMPWILLLLPMGFVFAKWLPKKPVPVRSAVRVPFYAQVKAMQQSRKNPGALQNRFTLLSGLVFACLVTALAGPRWTGAPVPATYEGYNLMLALDLSGSMNQDDMVWRGMPVTRLSTVVRAASEFVKARTGDNVGLIVFGTRAYLQTPLTPDRQHVLLRLADATVGLAGNTTSIGDALGLAVKRLQTAPLKGRVIVLLTDGANNSGVLAPLRAAALAKAHGIKVYTIGLGASRSADRFLDFVSPYGGDDLDEKTLKAIARETGGQYFRATDPQSLANIYLTINLLEPVNHEAPDIRPRTEYFPWPLGGAVLLMFLMLLPVSGRGRP